ncbi:MAG: hypothetical protein K9M82_09545, partial [Deltaproteobacteria bacterium]|nr:hypothetical protein [Deltaproteobacteria bacterium]
FVMTAVWTALLGLCGSAGAACTEPAMGDYTVYPVFQSNAVEPNIMLVVDNSGSMNGAAYNAAYDHGTRYYGYFEPYKRYSYSSGVFSRDTTGAWDGNFLNWASMRRVDVIRKVMMGGLATSRTGGGNQTNIGEGSGSEFDYYQYFGQLSGTSEVPASVSPCPTDTWFYIHMTGGDFEFKYYDWDGVDPATASWEDVGEASYTIRVKKGKDINGVALPDEDANFLDGNLAGIMQRLWARARFGLTFFNEGDDSKSRQNGGIIPRVIGSSMTDMINNIQNQASDTYTPLAETYYTVMKYFMQEDVEAYLDYANNVIPNSTAAQDPYNNPDPVHCAKSFVLLLTDGASTKDLYIPDALKDYDGDGNDGITVYDSGTTPEGRIQAQAGSDTDKTFYLNYIDGYAAGATRFSTGASPYPSGTTPFNDDYIGKTLVLFDSEDNQVYAGEITAVNYYDSLSGTSEIVVSGTTDTPEWESGASPYTYDLSWQVVTIVPNNESGGLHGSDYLDDVALYARTNDLRDDLYGDQNLILYNVYAFGSDSSARNLLKDAARNGGFEDKNGNRRPDLDDEWDADGDGDPDTFYEASDGYQLESQLLRAINDILQRAASGTAVSVLATSGEGEGNLVQAYFRPSLVSGTTEVTWVGYLQSLWADQLGNLREDTDGDLALDVTRDKIVSYFLDEADGDAKIRVFDVSGTTPYPNTETAAYDVVELDDINPLWEAGDLLAGRSADERKIFTYVDMDRDGLVDDAGNDPFDDIGEAVRFHASGATTTIRPYLGVRDDATWDYLGATQNDRVHNLIEYIRGKEDGFTGVTPMLIRSRILEDDVWKLGDIVQSTPVAVSKPPENYHVIYSDESYQDYYDAYKDRETVVYVGANDGMLHAFTSWQYSSVSKQYTKPSGAPAGESIGDEIWAYIPQSLLPHLKWLPYWDYTHTYYADLKPKVFDAKIFPDNTHYSDGDGEDDWGTVLLLGLNMGGKQICAEDWFDDGTGTSIYETRTFHPSYAAIDITEPRNPKLLWERTYEDLGMSMSIPAVVRVKDEWFAVFGSGPTTYDGTSTNSGHVYVVDLKTGNAYPNLTEFGSGATNAWLFETSESSAFMNSPTSLDKELNFNVDVVYIGESYDSGSWLGKVYRIGVPWDWSDTATYVDDPNHATNPWTFNELTATPGPVTADLALSIDHFDNVWVYGGTGRYLAEDDKSSTEPQYLFGLVDPFFNAYYETAPDDYYHDYTKAKTLDFSTDLFNADPYIITSSGKVYDDSLNLFGTWDDLVDAARTKDGWRRTLDISGERSLAKFTILGGIAFAPSFLPSGDICGFGGDSYLYGLYFETGTPYYKSVFEDDTETIIVEEDGVEIEYDRLLGRIHLGAGKSSPLGVHVGREEGAKAFIQQSTGTVVEEIITPAFKIKSGLISWREMH